MQLINIRPLVKQVPLIFSPSKVNFILKCPLRGLYENISNQDYRESGTNRYALLGNLIHKVFKAVNQVEAGIPVEFDALWNKYELLEAGGALKETIPNYGKLKYLTRGQVEKSFPTEYRRKTAGYYNDPEKTITDEVLGLKGQPDLLLFRNFRPYEIKDYKTGSVFETPPEDVLVHEEEQEFEHLKEDYKNQLYLYAHLVFKKFGSYPKYLTIVPPGGEEIRSICDPASVEALIDEVSNCMSRLNTEDLASLACPSKSNCIYCPFKPGCPWHVELNDYVKDLKGKVAESTIHAYGNFSLILEDGRIFLFKMVWTGDAKKICNLKGEEVFISHVREENTSKKLYTPTKATKLYIKKFAE